MTKKELEFEKLDAAIEGCKKYQKALEDREAKQKEMYDYKSKAEKIYDELKNRVEKPREIDDVGILSYVNCYCYYSTNDNFDYSYDEARTVDITENDFIVETDRNSRYAVPINEIREKGYYYREEDNLIFVDRIDNSVRFKEVIDIIVKQRKASLLKEIGYYKNRIKEYQDKLKEFEENLPQYDDYNISKVDKIAKHISFPLGLDYKEIEEFENDFPRVYKV